MRGRCSEIVPMPEYFYERPEQELPPDQWPPPPNYNWRVEQPPRLPKQKRSAATRFRIIFVIVQIVFLMWLIGSVIEAVSPTGNAAGCDSNIFGSQACSQENSGLGAMAVFLTLGVWVAVDVILFVIYYVMKGSGTQRAWSTSAGWNRRRWQAPPPQPLSPRRGPTEPKPYSTAPDWYPDPWGVGNRWWDGQSWTEETS
jgi:hypothetical protein